MRKTILWLWVLVVCGSSVPRVFCQDAGSVKQLRKDIQIINLLNSLDLNRDQAQQILAKARLAQSYRYHLKDYEAALEETLRNIRQDVVAGKVQLSDQDRQSFHRHKERMEEEINRVRKDTESLARDVEGILEPFQHLALDGYRPCVVPIVQEGRIGQADSPKGLTRISDRARSMTDQQYLRNKDKLIASIQKMKKLKHTSLSSQEVFAKAHAYLQAVRSLSEADYLLKKASLAQEFLNEVAPTTAVLSRKQKIQMFLLADESVAVLEERLSQLR